MFNTRKPLRSDLPSSSQLKRSTILAFCVSTFLMITVVLPAEYGLDPTGMGDILGLTSMGKIKQSLAQEASLEKTSKDIPAIKSDAVPKAEIVVSQESSSKVVSQTAKPAATIAEMAPSAKTDAMEITLTPGQGAEVKLEMKKGAEVTFEWDAEGGPVNFDAHGDPYNAQPGFFHGYKKGRQVEGDQGVLTAAFDGKHGWFWRNRGGTSVTIKLVTKGDYIAIKRVS